MHKCPICGATVYSMMTREETLKHHIDEAHPGHKNEFDEGDEKKESLSEA